MTYAALAGAGGAVEESSCDVLIQGVVIGGNVVVTLLTIRDVIEAEQLTGKRGRMDPLGPSMMDPTPSQKLKERPHSKPTPCPLPANGHNDGNLSKLLSCGDQLAYTLIPFAQQTDTTMGIY